VKKNKIFLVLSALILSVILLGIVYGVFMLLTFDLAGGETLQQVEGQTTGIYIIVLLIALLALSVTGLKKRISYLFVCIAVVSTVSFAGYRISHYSRFDEKVWKMSERKPFAMAATLVRNDSLDGLTKNQVSEMLGNPYREFPAAVEYLVTNNWTLTIYFDKDIVNRCSLRLPFLGV